MEKIRYTWVKCHTGHCTQYLRFSLGAGANEIDEGSSVGDYYGGYSFVIRGGENHDKLVSRFIELVQKENKETPGKHRAEVITVYEKSIYIDDNGKITSNDESPKNRVEAFNVFAE